MRRKVFFTAIIILAGLALYFYSPHHNMILNPFNSKFSIENPERITKINISDPYGTNQLVKTAKGWKISNVVLFRWVLLPKTPKLARSF